MDQQGSKARDAALQDLEQVVIRFAGDSGDGMQLTGNEFTRTTAIMGNDLATFPDFPAEIRAPAGTLPGVSAFQLRFASVDIHTPGDTPDVLVAMNPAALKVHIGELRPGGLLILNTAKFRETELKKARYESDPRQDGSLDAYRLVEVDLEQVTREALKDAPLDAKAKDRCKNMFALGILYWLYHRDLEPTLRFIDELFGRKKPEIADANKVVLRAGYNYADITGLFQTTFRVPRATFMAPGRYRNIMGNQALCLGLVAAAKQSGLPILLGSYPITPASDILHQLSGYKHHDIVTFQAEDEIAAVCAAIGASYAGVLGVTSTSGPGVALKSEAINLAVMTELPLVIVDVQRGGPSTGLPTKTEQADLLQAMFGRNSDSPVPIVCATTPGDAFDAAFEAARIAIEYMTPVFLLSDGYIANSSEPWRIPDVSKLPKIPVRFAPARNDGSKFLPYERDPRTLARPWAKPGTPGLMHRIGGIEKQDVTGNISYDPKNHEHMVHTRAGKVAGIAKTIAPLQPLGAATGDVLVLGWGSTRGSITAAVLRHQKQGRKVSAVFLRHLNPFAPNLGELLRGFRKVIVPEMNLGQLCMLLRARFLVDAEAFTKVQGRPFTTEEIEQKIQSALEGLKA
ncbi:MAG: 2-oxoacid:acceptor oxidoreductase subunit alpha [Planctomycetes bacterium]|nr:2-oxoacid:acceptor oxidoreductase subunit alpha [Planctomycetota bacterium]